MPGRICEENTPKPKTFRIIHFNDVYEIEDRDLMHPGAAKFASLVKVSHQGSPVRPWTWDGQINNGGRVDGPAGGSIYVVAKGPKGVFFIELKNVFEFSFCCFQF